MKVGNKVFFYFKWKLGYDRLIDSHVNKYHLFIFTVIIYILYWASPMALW